MTDAHEQKRTSAAANGDPRLARVAAAAAAAADAASGEIVRADGPQAISSVGRQEKRVSQQTVERLSVYRKVLEELDHEGVEYVHSQELAPLVGVTPAQLRRDLASFGTFGNIARGYNVYQMSRTMSRLLGTETIQTVALFGVGDLGRALLSYRGFEERGFHIGLAFDVAPDKIGRVFAGRRCYPLDELDRLLPEQDVRIALLACRAQGLQLLVDRIARAGVNSFVNFVPKRITPPAGGWAEDIDIAARMEKLSFLAKAAADAPRGNGPGVPQADAGHAPQADTAGVPQADAGHAPQAEPGHAPQADAAAGTGRRSTAPGTLRSRSVTDS